MLEVDVDVLMTFLGVGSFCFGIVWFFKSHAVKYDESHARNKVEHELIIETLQQHTEVNEKLTKSVKKLIKKFEDS